MAQSYTTVPTYTTGSNLAQADWNNVAAILNNGMSVVSGRGTYAGATPGGSNPTAPFFVYAAIREDSTDASGILNFPINANGFPNGLIAVFCTPTTANSSGTSQAGHTIQPIMGGSSGSTAASIYLIAYQPNGTVVQSTPFRYNVFAIGY